MQRHPNLGATCSATIHRPNSTTQVAVADQAAADRLIAGALTESEAPATYAEYHAAGGAVLTYTPTPHTAHERCPVALCRGSLLSVATQGARVLLRCPQCGVVTYAMKAAS